MKTTRNNIEEEVKRTLASLDNVQPASPRPFLYTRIEARMENMKKKPVSVLELKPIYQRLSVAVLVVLVVFNVITASFYLGSSASTGSTATELSEEEVYFEQYYTSVTTIDNLEENIIE
jgi:hypothetical protein